MRWLRVRSGQYRTDDGMFTVTKDPTGGDQPLGWGYSSWVVHKKIVADDSDGDALTACGTLRDAKAFVAAVLRNARPRTRSRRSK